MSNLTSLYGHIKGKEARRAAFSELETTLKKKENRELLRNLSLQDLAIATLGKEAYADMATSGDSFAKLREAVDPVNLSAFTNITQLLVLEAGLQTYQAPELVGSSLVTEETARTDRVRKAATSPVNDDAQIVKEGEEFPNVKFGEDYQDLPSSEKRGLKFGITKEMIFFDQTGDAMSSAQRVGEILGKNKDKRILRVVLGLDNNYNRNGVASNTYLTTGNRINSIDSNPLVDWRDLDDVNALFTNMKDDRTDKPEPIMVVPDTLIVSPFKEMTARSILTATEVRTQPSGSSTTTISASPAARLTAGLRVVTSQWLDWLLVNEGGVSAANARNYWYMGNPRKAFRYRTLFPFAMIQANSNDTAEFERDIVMQFRGSERGVAYVDAPWQMARSRDVA